MSYYITIVKIEENPNFDKERLEEYRRSKDARQFYNNHNSIDFDNITMNKTRERPALQTIITDVEFQTIKKSVLEVM